MAKIDEIENFVKSKMTKKSTIQELQGVFCLEYKQLLTHLKKSPVLFHLSSVLKLDREAGSIVYYIDRNTILYPTGIPGSKEPHDLLYKMREERQNKYIRSNYSECKNILELIGTYIIKHRYKPHYITVRSLYMEYKHLFNCNISNQQLYRVNVNKVCHDFDKLGIDYSK